MEIQCPNCGGYRAIIDEGNVSTAQKLLSFLTLSLYNPWEREYKRSVEKFFLGEREATCEICGYRFKSTEKIDKERIYQNRHIRLEGEKRLAETNEKEQEKLRNYPKF